MGQWQKSTPWWTVPSRQGKDKPRVLPVPPSLSLQVTSDKHHLGSFWLSHSAVPPSWSSTCCPVYLHFQPLSFLTGATSHKRLEKCQIFILAFFCNQVIWPSPGQLDTRALTPRETLLFNIDMALCTLAAILGWWGESPSGKSVSLPGRLKPLMTYCSVELAKLKTNYFLASC
jgi:hypothetical protein